MRIKAKSTEWFQLVVLRGIEGIVADKFMEQIVDNEWRSAVHADEALANSFEAKYIAQQLYARIFGYCL